MSVNRENYESWFLDYHEGILNAEAVAELFLFLEQHPDLKAEFESFESILLDTPEELSLSDKPLLKKSDADFISETDHLLIAELEGDLNQDEQKKLERLLTLSPTVAADRELFRQTVSVADPEIQFPNKSSLKRNSGAKVIAFRSRVWYAAAAVLFLLLAGTLWLRHAKTQISTSDSELANQVKPAPEYSTTIPAESDSLTPAKSNTPLPIEQPSLAQKTVKQKKHEVVKKTEKEEQFLPASNMAAEKQLAVDNQLDSASLDLLDELTAALLPTDDSTPLIQLADIHPVSLPAEVLPVHNTIELPGSPEEAFSELQTLAANKVTQLATPQDYIVDGKKTKMTFGSRLIHFAAVAINRISNNKVQIKTGFDPISGNLAAYEVAVGKKQWQKQF